MTAVRMCGRGTAVRHITRPQVDQLIHFGAKVEVEALMRWDDSIRAACAKVGTTGNETKGQGHYDPTTVAS